MSSWSKVADEVTNGTLSARRGRLAQVPEQRVRDGVQRDAAHGALVPLRSEIAVLTEMHWTHDEYLAQPWDLVEELVTMLQKRALHERRQAQRAQKHGK